MAPFVIGLGLVLSLCGIAVIYAGAPDWALGLALGSAMIESGAIAFVGGLVLFGIGLVLRSLRQLDRRLDMLAPLTLHAAPLAPSAAAPSPGVVDLPAEVPVSLAHPVARALSSHEVRPASAERDEEPPHPAPLAPAFDERPTGARAWPPATRTAMRGAESPLPPLRPRNEARLAEHPLRGRTEPLAPPVIEEAPSITQPPHGRASEAEPEAAPTSAVVRSGIIGGMAYTLYADGSIEAELPMGTMRFASLDELRAHVSRSGAEADAEFGAAPRH
jgi:hypothetical protein